MRTPDETREAVAEAVYDGTVGKLQMAHCFHIADAALGALKSNDQLESGLRVVKWIGFARTGMPRATDGDAS